MRDKTTLVIQHDGDMLSLGQIESALCCEVVESYGGNYIAELRAEVARLEKKSATEEETAKDMIVRCNELAAELDQLKASQQWQPIESAPKDGTYILVHGGVAHWYNDQWYTLTGEVYPGKPIQWDVTRFMPLPAAPEQGETK